jgi:hypothetical protein
MNTVSGRPVDRDDNRGQDERVKLAELLTKKAIQPTEAEQNRNPRSRSARLRASSSTRPMNLRRFFCIVMVIISFATSAIGMIGIMKLRLRSDDVGVRIVRLERAIADSKKNWMHLNVSVILVRTQ